MQEAVHYMETGSVDPYYNLAFEEYVLTRRTSGDHLLLWQNDNTIVVGSNQNTEEEISRQFVEEHGIRVIRRATGGGAVYHDLGNLNYSFITDVGDAGTLTMERFTRPVVDVLRSLGLDASASGRNDILIGDRKVSGTAQRIAGDRILHHGTLLFDSSADVIAGALRADPEKFRSKSSKSVRSRVGNIREFLAEDMTLTEFWDYIREHLLGSDFVMDGLSEQEKEEVRRLQREKYETWEWNYGKSPAYDMMNTDRYPGGRLEVRLSVKKGLITGIAFYGDYMSRISSDPLAEMLTGCPCRKEAVKACLDKVSIRDMFGGITQQEILSTIFNE